MAFLLFKQIAALFLIMASGWLLVRLGLLKSWDSHVLSVFTIYAIMPCLMVKSFQIDLTERVLRGFLLAVAAAALCQLCLFAINVLCKKLLKLGAVERASVIYTNAGNLIITLVVALLGEEWVIYSSAFMCIQQLALWTHGQAMLSSISEKPNWKNVLLNVNLLSILLGVILMLANIRLPEILMSAVSAMAGMIGPVSMFLTGMLLAGANLRAIFTNRRIYLVSFLRLVLVPLILLAILKLTGLAALSPDGKTVLYICFLAVMAPSATMVTQLAALHRNRPEYASSINAATTLLCIVTMPLLTQLFMYWI